MPTWGYYTCSRKFWYRSKEKHFRGSFVIDGLQGEGRRKWRIVDRYFDRQEKEYVHEVVPGDARAAA